MLIQGEYLQGSYKLPINDANGKASCFESILQAINQQMMNTLSHHNKVICVRFDLTFGNIPIGFDTRQNKLISDILDKFTRWHKYTKRAGVLGYVWVREQAKNNPHYHACLFLNGSIFNTSRPIINKLCQIVHGLGMPKGVINYPKHYSYRKISRTDYLAFATAFHHYSYLAKTRTKKYTPKKVRKFSQSQIKANPLKIDGVFESLFSDEIYLDFLANGENSKVKHHINEQKAELKRL